MFHEVAFYVSLGLGVALVMTADGGRARVAAAVFATTVAVAFGTSALYHRPTWTPGWRTWLARLDHAGIYFLIAGTYTPLALILMPSAWAATLLAVVWGGAVGAILLKVLWARAPKWVSAALGLALGWSGIVAFPELLSVPVAAGVLALAGGLLYTAGAVVYIRRSPDPAPAAFGYHEVFHALTLAAAGCQYSAIAFFILPRA